MLSAPLLWVAVLIARRPVSFAALKMHAALYTVCLAITIATDGGGHSSPGETFADAILDLLYVVLGTEALVAFIVSSTMKEPLSGDPELPKFIYIGLTAAFLGGALVGALAWSEELPIHVIAAAEAAAVDRPYCIDVQGEPARRTDDLTCLKTWARSHCGWTFDFHALLVIGSEADRTYMNWSF
ncbi:MAG: hypothetical protein ACRD9W_26150, partial [Terriglobia bacterium]